MRIPTLASAAYMSRNLFRVEVDPLEYRRKKELVECRVAYIVKPLALVWLFYNTMNKEEAYTCRKWQLLSYTLALGYTLAKREEFSKKLPSMLFNPAEIILDPFRFIGRFSPYVNSAGATRDFSKLKFAAVETAKSSLVAGALFLYMRNSTAASKLSKLEKSMLLCNFTAASVTASYVSNIDLIRKYVKFEEGVFTLKRILGSCLATINYQFMKGVFKNNPMLGTALQVNTHAQLLSEVALSIDKIAGIAFSELKEIYNKLQLIAELEDWRDSLPEGSTINKEKVFSNILEVICKEDHNFTILDLQQCGLETVPPIVWKLTKIEALVLTDNKLEELPSQIKNLKKLRYLGADKNRLSALPSEIRELSLLITINLKDNLLTSLPQEIGEVEQLRTLNLEGNSGLTTLPASTGSLIHLETLYYTRTGLEESQLLVITREIEERKARGFVASLPDIIRKWKYLANIQDDSLDFIEELEDIKKRIIVDWLLRVEQTLEFRHGNKENLAVVVSDILKTLKINPSFKEDFFSYVAANNTNCEDRAAMALNEIYVLWVIFNLKESESSFEQKIKILLRAVKTYTFRYYISSWIEANVPESSESVEIFLFYDNLLKEKLELLSPIGVMQFGSIGDKLAQLPEAKVIKDVEASYLENIFKYPALEKLIESDSDFIAMQQEKMDDLTERMESTDKDWNDKKNTLTRNTREYYDEEGRYKEQSDALQKEYEGAKKEVAISWLKQKGYLSSSFGAYLDRFSSIGRSFLGSVFEGA